MQEKKIDAEKIRHDLRVFRIQNVLSELWCVNKCHPCSRESGENGHPVPDETRVIRNAELKLQRTRGVVWWGRGVGKGGGGEGRGWGGEGGWGCWGGNVRLQRDPRRNPGGGTSRYKPNRYVPPRRVSFQEFLVWDRVQILSFWSKIGCIFRVVWGTILAVPCCLGHCIAKKKTRTLFGASQNPLLCKSYLGVQNDRITQGLK